MQCKLQITLEPSWIEATINHLFEIGLRGVEILQESPEGIICTYCDSAASADTFAGEIQEYLESLKELWPDAAPFQIDIEDPVNQDWANEWKKHFNPVEVTSRLVIRPSWAEYLPVRTEKVMLLGPGMAFGIGTHETTRLALEAIDRLIENGRINEIDSVLDIGCGSGILAIAAVMQGIPFAVGIDTDPASVRCANENARQNGVEGACVFVRADPSLLYGHFPLILANIDTDTLLLLAGELRRLLSHEGLLFLTGIVDRRQEEIEEAYRSAGFKFVGKFVREPWALLEFKSGDA